MNNSVNKSKAHEIETTLTELELVESSLKIGQKFFCKNGEKIVKVIALEERCYDQDETKRYTLIKYSELLSYENDTWSDYNNNSSFKDFSTYYDVTNPIEDLKDLYECVLEMKDLDSVPEYKETFQETGTDLVAMNSKENLLQMKSSIEDLIKGRDQLDKMLKFQMKEVERKFSDLRRKLQAQVVAMQKQITRIMRVVSVIELYVGIKEDLFQLQEGRTADENEVLSLRQQVLYMDEETAILEDQGIDVDRIEEFDEWLIKDKNYENILPEERGIVCFHPRRGCKKDYDGWAKRDDRNKWTYFLIRNGENIYRIFTPNFQIGERLFPKRQEFQELIEEINKGSVREEKAEDFTYLYQKVTFFIQGLIDRTDVFSPMKKKLNLFEVNEEQPYQLIYDDELCLPTERLPFKEWQKEINSKIEIGSRIIWANSVGEERRSNERFLKDYSQWSRPNYPKDGLYVIEEYKRKQEYYSQEENKWKTMIETGPCFRYNPKDMVSTWTSYGERKNRISFCIEPQNEVQVLNFDQMDLNDIEFYLKSRIDRKNYLSYIPILKEIKKQLLEEEDDERSFSKMLRGLIKFQELKAKKNKSIEESIENCINWWKYKNKWKRAISKDDVLAMRMIERKLFSKKFIKENFELNN